MKRTSVKTTLLLLVGFLLTTQSMAQKPVDTDERFGLEPFSYCPSKTKVPIWLNSSVGLNVADCYDNGTVPFRYTGLGANLNLGVTVEWWRCHIQTDARVLGNMLTQLNGYAIGIESRTEFLYRFHDSSRNRWHFWVGGGLQNYIDVKEIPAMMNAAVGVTTFENVFASGLAQFDFAFIKGGSHHLLTAYGKLTLPLIGMAERPGYAYMDNYTGDLNQANTILGDYETLGKTFPGVSTDIGLYFNLLNGNRIGFSYRWDYLSTGNKGIYRYDNAFHSINVNLMFRIN